MHTDLLIDPVFTGEGLNDENLRALPIKMANTLHSDVAYKCQHADLVVTPSNLHWAGLVFDYNCLVR
jgi:hypothetical protein